MKKFYLDCSKNKFFCDGKKYNLEQINYIAIHNTGNTGDKAESNAKYFKTNKIRYAGSSYIIGRKGYVYQCCELTHRPYAVGGDDYKGFKRKIYPKPTNKNTISIELCDIVNKDISKKQLNSLKKIIKEIRKQCPNIIDVIRHYDVNGKPCPVRYCGSEKNNKKWVKLKKQLNKYL